MALQLLAANNAQTVLAAGISSSATSLTVNTGTGSLFPSPASGTSFFKLTLVDAATGLITEIVHVTARSGDVMTIERAQEGTVARAWSANDIAANMMTAGTLSYVLGNFLSRSNPFGDIKADGTVNTAKINLGIQAFNSSGSTTTVSAPTSGVFFYVTDSGNWGVIDSVGNQLPLPIAGGGTGANTLLGARVNLGVSAFGSDSDRSTASSPNAAAYTFITNYGDWGASDSSGKIIPLSLGRGGTAATDAATARTNLGLKTAATRDVGVGSGQIPDMGSFQFSAVAKGYEKLPSGQIRQWGTISIQAANASTDFALDTFAIPFPNGVLNCRANGTATTTNTPCFATAEVISTTQIRLKAIAIDLSNKTITQGMAVTVAWEAIGA
ncbi:TPA: hypothetical protein N5L07_003443 [Enterobacter asburiae]|nr:hypothetical protein [Enterobacter asburiae]